MQADTSARGRHYPNPSQLITLTELLTILKVCKNVCREGDIECDEILYARLRELRKCLVD